MSNNKASNILWNGATIVTNNLFLKDFFNILFINFNSTNIY